MASTDTTRLALAGAREYVVKATRGTDPSAQRAAGILALIDNALAQFRPPEPPRKEEPWDWPENDSA